MSRPRKAPGDPCSAATVDLSELLEKWPSPIVMRQDIGRFSGGLIKSRRLANLDSVGLGPEDSFYVGRKRAYWARNVVHWLEKRSRHCATKGAAA